MKKDVLEEKVLIPKGIKKTTYKKLKNCYIYREYEFDDFDCVVKRKRDEDGKIIEEQRICDGITMVQRTFDYYRECEYIDYEFYSHNHKTTINLKFKSSEIGTTAMIRRLSENGFTIYNTNSFTYFINSMRDAINKVIKYNEQSGYNIDFFKTKYASSKYGFLTNDDGTMNLETFVDGDTIITNKALKDVDGPLFQKKGSLENWKNNMDKISEAFKEPTIFRLILAMELCGVTVSFISDVYDNPVMCVEAPTSTGKTLPAGCAATQWGRFTKQGHGLTRSILDSAANRDIIQDRLNTISMIITDMQSAIIKYGIDWVIDFLYKQTEGTGGGHATIEGELRDNKREWITSLMFFCESDQFGDLTGGSNARLIRLLTHVKNGEQFTKDGIDIKDLYEYEISDFGWAGPAYVEKMIEYNKANPSAIMKKMNSISNEINKTFKQSKKSNSLAILLFTYNKCIEWGIYPEHWGKLSIADILPWFAEENASMEPLEKIKAIWDTRVIADPGFPNLGDKVDYDERRGTPREIRGRKEYIESENCYYIYVSNANLQQQFDYIAGQWKVYGYKYSIEKVKDYGWAVRYPVNERYQWTKTNITQKEKEKVYVIRVPLPEREEEYKSMKELAPVINEKEKIDKLMEEMN